MPSSSSLVKQIGFWSATTIVLGSIIGSGVFMKPSSMAAELGSPIWLTAVWIIAGFFSLLGALIYAELGAMMPETGGLYVFFRKMYGEFPAFLYGWSAFAVINTAAVAAISFVCAWYADYFLQLPHFDTSVEQAVTWHIPFIGDLHPLENAGVKLLAVMIVLALTLLNHVSLKGGSVFQVISTFAKTAVIGALVVGIFFSGKGELSNLVHADQPAQGWGLVSGLVIAMTGAFYAYDGWINVTFIAGEIKEPQKNIPRSLIIGVLTCILVYVLVNLAYLYVLPVEKIAGSSLVASDAIRVALGDTGGALIAAMIVLCTLGAVNGNILASCRVTYAMGKDKVFLPWAGKASYRFHTPGNALWLHGIWTSVFIITGSFDMLADMFVFITWIAYGAGAIGLLLLRRKMQDIHRPYRVWGYPVLPLLFIAFSLFYLVVTIVSDISNYLAHRQPVINSLLGIVITLLGVPLYFYGKKKQAPGIRSSS